MSVEQIEEQVRQLPPEDLARFVSWFDSFVGRTLDHVDELTEQEKAELLRRRAELIANPALAQTVDDQYFDDLKRDYRTLIEGRRSELR